MAKFLGSTSHTILIVLPHLLAFASFGILLGGVASMQNDCGSSVNNALLGTFGYLGDITCDRFYSFDWWITFWQGFVWLYTLYFIFGRKIHLARNALTGLLINAAILLMAMTNTW